MKKSSFYYLLMLLVCTTFFVSCSDDDDDPNQAIIENSTPRIVLGDDPIELGDSQPWIYYNPSNNVTEIHAQTQNGADVVISYTGKPEAGAKSTPVEIRIPGNVNADEATYKADQIKGLNVLKVVEPTEETDGIGKIWVVATVDGQKLEFVVPFVKEGDWE